MKTNEYFTYNLNSFENWTNVEDLNQLIFIGKITKAIGVRGHLKVIPLTDFPERFNKLKEIFLFDEMNNKLVLNAKKQINVFKIKDTSIGNNFIKLKLDGYDDINEVSIFYNKLICIDEKKRVKLPKGLYYYYEMIGCDVYEGKLHLGKVIKIDNFGSSDILFISTNKDKEIMIPLLKEFVTKIDIIKKRMDVKLIEGLIDYDEVWFNICES